MEMGELLYKTLQHLTPLMAANAKFYYQLFANKILCDSLFGVTLQVFNIHRQREGDSEMAYLVNPCEKLLKCHLISYSCYTRFVGQRILGCARLPEVGSESANVAAE